MKLGESGHEIDLTGELARHTLNSQTPLKALKPLLPTSELLEFARGMWEELQHLKTESSLEKFKMSIAEGVMNVCVDIYKTFRRDFESRFSISHIRRFATSLNRKIRKECSESYERLEAALKQEELAFIASQKDHLSRKDSTGSLTLTVESCHLIERSGRETPRLQWVSWGQPNEDPRQKISVSFSREEFEKETITWHGFELAPMKDDLDQLILDNEHAFTPSCSANKEIIDLDPSSQMLSRVVFLKAGHLLVFIIEGHNDPKTLLIYLCPKLGVKLTTDNCIRRFKRGIDLVAFDERSRFIALYDYAISTIKTFRFDETFHHMDWTGVDIALSEYLSIGRSIWMDFVTGKSEIVFIDDLNRVRLCEVNERGMVRSINVHIGHTPIVKACVTTQGSCLLLLRNIKCTEKVRQQEVENEAEFDVEPDSEGLDTEMTADLLHPSADRTDTQDVIAASVGFEEQCLTMDVYKLDDSIQHFTSIPLEVNIKDLSKLVVGFSSFSSQMHLLIFDRESPSVVISKVIKISSASEVCQLQQVTRPEEVADTEKNLKATQSGPVLDYVYQIFEKYATSPPLTNHPRDLHLRMFVERFNSNALNHLYE